MLMDVKYVFNLLGMVVHQQQIVTKKDIADGRNELHIYLRVSRVPAPQTKLIISIHTGILLREHAVSRLLFENKIR
jgi:hypothetical protein